MSERIASEDMVAGLDSAYGEAADGTRLRPAGWKPAVGIAAGGGLAGLALLFLRRRRGRRAPVRGWRKPLLGAASALMILRRRARSPRRRVRQAFSGNL